MSIKSICSEVQFNSNISLLILCLDYLSIADSSVLRFPTITVLLSICPLRSVNYLLNVFQCSGVGSIYIYDCSIFLMYWHLSLYIRTFFVSCYPSWLEVYFAWYKYNYAYLLVSIYLDYHLPSFHFESMHSV